MCGDRVGGKCEDGFSVIEVMVVVAIVAILTTIAIPSYQAQILKTRRTEAQSLLLDIASRQELYYADNKTFTTDMTELGFSADPVLSENEYYQADAVAGDTGDISTSFVGTATRRGAQTADTHCGDFTIDANGTRAVANYAGADEEASPAPPAGCW
ncbi:MAG: prepilin-type N-terminal cleavage/methylation domain-containing protein [Gammaproteobacteria bacterium]|jgi:type IV pilus assembly protein PilE|nr:prepilin-type N-terminal cleavage/methylation domain-containing protein [Gammaproteobacteria bacterium]